MFSVYVRAICVYGQYVTRYMNLAFLRISRSFVLRSRVFSRVSCCGARRSPARTLRRTFGPRPSIVARALDAQKCASKKLFKWCGMWCSVLPPPRRRQRKPTTSFCGNFSFSSIIFWITPSVNFSRPLSSGTHCTTAVAHHALEDTDGAPVCGRVCHLSCRPTTGRN